MLGGAFKRWRSFAPSSAVVGHKTQTRLGPSVHLFSGRAVERAVGYNASGPVAAAAPPLQANRGVEWWGSSHLLQHDESQGEE